MKKADFAKMAHDERMAALWRDINSPAVVDRADELLALIQHEWMDVRGMRERAAERHGDKRPSPSGDGLLVKPALDSEVLGGTVESLVAQYRTNPQSGYLNLRHGTKRFYDTLIKRLLTDCGDRKISDLKQPDILRLYEKWGEGNKVAMAHALMTMLRTLANFGAKTLGDDASDHLAILLHRTHFAAPKAQTEQLRAEQAVAVRAKLREMGYGSMALAQAIQFDLMLRQKDVIGEWVPISEPGESNVFRDTEKWIRGLRWEEIDNDLILRHVDSFSQKEVVFDLKKYPMVMDELKNISRREKGPVIERETNGLPWVPNEFRRIWRKAADLCGIPRSIKNRASRENSRRDRRGTDSMEKKTGREASPVGPVH